MRRVAATLVDLVLPLRCVRCGAPGRALCADCIGPVEPFAVDLPVEDGPPVEVHAVGPYEDGLRAAVIAYKERGRRDVGRELAWLLSTSLSQALDGCEGRAALVAVPSSRAAARARGGQHVLRLARAAAPHVGALIAPDALRLVRATRDSAGLGVDARQANLAGAMAAARPPAGHPAVSAVVVDDVVTTGASLAEAVRALRQAGWRIGGAAVIAATPRRFPRAASVRQR